jgi:hypothetical protein
LQLVVELVSIASYEPLFIDLGLLEEEVEKILESNYDVYLENRKRKQIPNRDLLQVTRGFP